MKKYILSTAFLVSLFSFVFFAAANTPIEPSFNFSQNLTIGSTGTDVINLQSFLIVYGYAIPAITNNAVAKGYFGYQTKIAVQKYQSDHNVPSTGFVGPLTRAKLNGPTAPPPLEKMQVCPDEKIVNKMPTIGPGDPNAAQYYIYKGKSYPPSAFDEDWVGKNCTVKQTNVY